MEKLLSPRRAPFAFLPPFSSSPSSSSISIRSGQLGFRIQPTPPWRFEPLRVSLSSSEGVTTTKVMRGYNVPEAYEKLKDLTRGRVVSKESIQKFTNGLQLPKEAKSVLLNLSPQSYIGEAEKLSKSIYDHVDLVNGFRLL
ncbi:uncharacterized protein LOC109844309 [Asparagus officinalis]|uniref:uncharacterized protein LOC109844309 n=1 Tax=Asparagus officinalis TaxID=4686 RepID=UPI00098DFA21|nr:uncharacterized protein LOC109844309 [Asparagus officinalis]